MDVLTTLNAIRDAKNNFYSIHAINYALDNFDPAVEVDHLRAGLASCKYSKNSQLMALAAIPEEGQSERLLLNMNLQELTDTEMSFLTSLFPTILRLCAKDYEMEFPGDLKKETVLKFAKLNDPIFYTQMLESFGLNNFTANELMELGLTSCTHDMMSKIFTSIFTDVSVIKNSLKGIGITDKDVANYKHFIGKIAKIVQYGEDADKIVEPDETLLRQLSSEKNSENSEFINLNGGGGGGGAARGIVQNT